MTFDNVLKLAGLSEALVQATICGQILNADISDDSDWRESILSASNIQTHARGISGPLSSSESRVRAETLSYRSALPPLRRLL